MKTPLPPLNALRAFEAAQRHMSFQKAAKELSVTPAALSYQIRQLEEFLQVKLFHRLNRAVELTGEGRLIAPGLEEGFDQLRRTMSRLTRRRRADVLVISAGPAFASKWLTPRLYRFLARHPEIDLRVSASLARADLTGGDVDIALRFGMGAYPACISNKLADEAVTPMCAPSLLAGPDAIKTPADLAGHTLIHDDTHIGVFEMPEWRDWLKAAGVSGSVPVAQGLHFNVADNALDAAIAGAGVVLGRKVLADGDLKAGRLVMPFSLRLKPEFAFFAVVEQGREREANIARFIDWLTDEMAGRSDLDTPGPAI